MLVWIMFPSPYPSAPLSFSLSHTHAHTHWKAIQKAQLTCLHVEEMSRGTESQVLHVLINLSNVYTFFSYQFGLFLIVTKNHFSFLICTLLYCKLGMVGTERSTGSAIRQVRLKTPLCHTVGIILGRLLIFYKTIFYLQNLH